MTDKTHHQIPWQRPRPASSSGDALPGSKPRVGSDGRPQADQPAGPPPLVPPPVGWRPGYRLENQQLSYHRLALADPKNRWWTPLVEVAIGLPLYIVLSIIAAVGFFLAVLTGIDPLVKGQVFGDLNALQDSALESPLVFAFVFGTVALMFPALWVARLIMGPKPWGLVHSVAGKMRWRWLLTCLALAFLLFAVLPLCLDLLLGAGTYSWASPSPQVSGTPLLILLVLVALIVPFQAYAEELVFRGYLMQTLGRWLKHPAWAIVLPAPLFMLGHTYDLWAQLSILVMGLTAGFITWRTGGLEAAIALHIVNNLMAMTLGIYGLVDPFVQEGSTWVSLLSALFTEGIYLLLVMWVAKRARIARLRPVQVWVKEG